MDLVYATKGHSLILPKDHYKNVYEIANDTAAKEYGGFLNCFKTQEKVEALSV